MTDRSQDIRNGVTVVTGAGAGLGRELCIRLVAEGVTVAGIGRKIEPLQSLADQLGGLFLPIVADVANPEDVANAFAKITDTAGTVTVLINNAAVYPRRDILDETPESFMHTVNINLGGVFHCCNAALPGMVANGYGRIVNLSTFAHVEPAPTAAAYSVSKGAARILTQSLVADLGDRFPDIVINDWIPGALNTGMGIPDGIDPSEAAKWGVRLALWHDPDLNGRVFDQDAELLAPTTLRRKILGRLTGRRRTRLRLS